MVKNIQGSQDKMSNKIGKKIEHSLANQFNRN